MYFYYRKVSITPTLKTFCKQMHIGYFLFTLYFRSHSWDLSKNEPQNQLGVTPVWKGIDRYFYIWIFEKPTWQYLSTKQESHLQLKYYFTFFIDHLCILSWSFAFVRWLRTDTCSFLFSLYTLVHETKFIMTTTTSRFPNCFFFFLCFSFFIHEVDRPILEGRQ